MPCSCIYPLSYSIEQSVQIHHDDFLVEEYADVLLEEKGMLQFHLLVSQLFSLFVLKQMLFWLEMCKV